MNYGRTLWLAALCLIPLSVQADTVAEKEKIAAQEVDFKDNLKNTNDTCGSSIAGKVDYASFKGSDPAGTHGGPAGFCEEALTALRQVCSTPEGKTAVKSEVKNLSCSYGGKDKRALALASGTLTYSIDLDGINDVDFATKYLKNNL